MPTAQAARSGRTSARPTKSAGWVPHQHGAWAMLIAPFVLGAVLRVRAEGWSWWIPTLFIGWMLGYFAFSVGSLWLKARKKAKYQRALITYSVLAAVFGLATIAQTGPVLLTWALAYLPLTGVTLWLVAHRKERATASGLLTIVAAALMAVTVGHPNPVTAFTAGAIPAWSLAGLAFAYFFGTVPYVKTLIRERGHRSWVIGSVAYHVVVTLITVVAAVLGALSWWWPVFFVAITIRALLVPVLGPMAGRTVTPKSAGFGEVFTTIVFAVIALSTL